MDAETIAFNILEQLQSHSGYLPHIDQVDIVFDEPTGHFVLYLYDGEACYVQSIIDPSARLDLRVLDYKLRQGSARPAALH